MARFYTAARLRDTPRAVDDGGKTTRPIRVRYKVGWGFLAFGFVRTSWKAQQLHDGGSLLKQAQNEWKLITSPAGSSSSNCTSVVEHKTKQNKTNTKKDHFASHTRFLLPPLKKERVNKLVRQ